MASQIDKGSVSGTASLVFITNGCSSEFHIPSGAPSLSPQDAPNIHPQLHYIGTVVNKTVAGIRFAVPA